MRKDELPFIERNVAQDWIVSYPEATFRLNVFIFDERFFDIQIFDFLKQGRFIDVFCISVV